MIGSRRTSQLSTVAAFAFGVTRVIETFMDDAVLDGEEMTVKGIHVLF